MVAVFWVIVEATHIHWVRNLDGPIHPISYSLAVVISVLAAAFLLTFHALSARRPAKSIVDPGGVNMPPVKDSFNSRVGQADGATGSPSGADAVRPDPGGGPRAAAGGDTVQYRAQAAEGIAGDGEPCLLVLSDTGQHRRMPIPWGGLVLGRRDQLGPPFSTDELISREHVSICLCEDGSVEVTDLGSTNGTYLNARKLIAPTCMEAGDVLRIGHVDIRLDPAPSTATSRDATVLAGRTVPSSAEDLLAEARALYDQNRFEEARQAFLAAADFASTRAEARYGLGMTALSLGDPATAERHFQAAVSADPRHANALYQLGVLKEQASQIQDAIGYYRRAVGANPSHASGMAALSRLERQTPAAAPPAAEVTPGAQPDLADGGLPSVYRFLVEDPTPISQQTVKLIHRVECEARPRYVAYVGRYFGRTLRMTVILAVLLVVLGIAVNLLHGRFPSNVPAAGPASRLIALAVACIILVPLATAIIGYISVLCTHIRIQKGRLQIEKGVFRKHLNNVDFWRVHNIDLDRRLINRFTGDGTLVFSLTFEVLPENYQRHLRRRKGRSGEVVEVCGIAQDAKLAELHQDLLNLTFLLRGNPIVKGIIQ